MVPPGGPQYRLQVSEGTLMAARKRGAGLVVLGVWAAMAVGGRAGAETRQVVIAPAYQKGAIERCLWGTDYRALWTAPITVEVLDLRTYAGGLKPAFRVGGQETKGLAMKGADGRDYTFRGMDKDPRGILPPDLQGTIAERIVQDQIAAAQPAGPVVVAPLLEAAGVPEIVNGTDMLKRLRESPRTRADTRAFLRARLMDMLVGDWDRHLKQWRWARIPGHALWQPIPEDRDQAFSRYEGLVLAMARPRQPRFVVFGREYPGIVGLTFNGWDQDRRLLAELEKPAW